MQITSNLLNQWLFVLINSFLVALFLSKIDYNKKIPIKIDYIFQYDIMHKNF